MEPTQQQPAHRSNTKACVAITVDMGVGASAPAVRQLVRLVGEHHLDTTWVVDHASHLSWVATLQNSSTSHALAINTNWVTQALSRRNFQRHFRQRWEVCEQASIVPATVYSTKPALLRQRLIHLTQYGLTTCIIGRPTGGKLGRWQRGAKDFLPQPLPLGIWQLPTTMQIPRRSRWLRRAPARRFPGLRRNVPAVARTHVLIVAEQVAILGSGGLRNVEYFLSKIAWASSANRLEVITAAEWATNLARRAAATPQRSILRRAG